MTFVLTLLLLAATPHSVLGIEPFFTRQAPPEDYIQACPNPDYQDLNQTVQCENFTAPEVPKGYGGRTCKSLTGTPLSVGSPQGISSARMFGNMNCTLYKSEDCLPDTPDNGYVVPVGGASALPVTFDDQTVAFNCKILAAQL
ncbi:hypothetical protein BX600DRAFT_286201 [Xylariales sp. PMI_506]|nr:hypothetical protein BX600DRAFT_286201 [Xylariales sp. PMI_506]